MNRRIGGTRGAGICKRGFDPPRAQTGDVPRDEEEERLGWIPEGEFGRIGAWMERDKCTVVGRGADSSARTVDCTDTGGGAGMIMRGGDTT